MSRVINSDGPGKQRTSLKRAVASAIRSLALSSFQNDEAQDIVAFIILCLEAITATVERTTSAWEKRDYWLKADRFRSEWAWADSFSSSIRDALGREDWNEIVKLSTIIAQHLNDVKISPKKRTDRPWEGAYEKVIGGK